MRKLLNIALLSFLLNFPVTSQTIIKCRYCGKRIIGKYVVYQGENYHFGCYEIVVPRCQHCGEPLEGEYIEYEGRKYHESCYMNFVALRCDLCGKPLRGKYIEDFWGTKYHPEHTVDRCEYCSRIISKNTTGGGFIYPDGRKICALCDRTAIMDGDDVDPVCENLESFFASQGIRVDIDRIPVHLVDRETLAVLSKDYSSNELGFCHYEKTTINGRTASQSNTIYVLYGLPLRTFEGVLAHELMHAWINLNARRQPSPQLNEGSANYLAYLVYSRYDDKLARHLMANIAESEDPIYGDGFRMVKKYVDNYGFRALLKRLKTDATLP